MGSERVDMTTTGRELIILSHLFILSLEPNTSVVWWPCCVLMPKPLSAAWLFLLNGQTWKGLAWTIKHTVVVVSSDFSITVVNGMEEGLKWNGNMSLANESSVCWGGTSNSNCYLDSCYLLGIEQLGNQSIKRYSINCFKYISPMFTFEIGNRPEMILFVLEEKGGLS